MEEIKKEFSVDDIELFRDDDDVDFAEVKLYALADGNNSHHNPISLDTLKKYGDTILGKFIIGKYSEMSRDTTTHVPSQSILGYVPMDQEVKYEEKDGKTFITVIGKLSKLYATDVVQMFKRDNFRNVSCEFSCIEADEDASGNSEILKFSIHGITILGLKYQPSCAGAEIKVIKFSENEKLNPITKFANSRKKEMLEKKSYKINKTELKDGSWGDVDKTSIRNDIMEAKNRDSLVNSVYLLVEDGWEDAPSEHLKYPVMELSNNTFYYNRNAFSSALTYAQSEDEKEVIEKLKKLYKKFKLEFPNEDSKGEEQDMSNKEFEIEGREAWGDVIKKVEDHEGDGVYVQSVEKDHIIFKKDDVVYRVEADVKAGKDDKNVSAIIDWSTKKKDKVQKDFEEEDKDKKDEKKEDEPKDEVKKNEDKEEKDKKKKMSLDANAESGALFTLLVNETKEDVELAKMISEYTEDDTVIMDKFVKGFIKMAKEKKELKEFREKTEAKETEATFNKSMADVKGDIEEKDYAKLFEEGKEIKDIDKMKEFSTRVKAFAYEYTKTNSGNSDFRYGTSNQTKPNTPVSVWDRIAGK